MRAYPAACSSLDDFFERTAAHEPIPTEFDNDAVQRYVEKIIVHPWSLEVVFKVGVKVSIGINGAMG